MGYYYDPNSTYQYYWVVITAPPQPLAITTPADGTNITFSSVNLAGTADPSTNAATVEFRVESTSGTSAWQTATGVASWSGTASNLVPGNNDIRVQSLDGSGNVIDTVTCKITYVVEGTLTVSLSGSGSVATGFAGVTLHPVGDSLTVKATPASGYVFAGWMGSIVSGSNPLKFTMVDGLNLQAKFELNPFPAVSELITGFLPPGPAFRAVSSASVSRGKVFSPDASFLQGNPGPSGGASMRMARPP